MSEVSEAPVLRNGRIMAEIPESSTWIGAFDPAEGRVCATLDDMAGAAIFDLDGVVRVWNPSIIRRAESHAGLPIGSLAAVVFEPSILSRAVTGVLTDEAWRAEIATTLEAKVGAGARMAVLEWSEPAGSIDADVLDVVRDVRRARPVALLTNATTRLRSDLARLDLLGEFDHIFNSSELGLAKPDERVFVEACERIGVKRSDAWFIDDSPRNVQAAAGVGLRAHDFVGVVALRAWIHAQPRT